MLLRIEDDALPDWLEDLLDRLGAHHVRDAQPFRYFVTVKGSGQFPIDMLRYDGLHPYGEDDSYKIAHDHEPREIKLTRMWNDRHWHPNYRRWESFLWQVVKEDSHEVARSE